ncbi:MAG TPA: carbohydrate-binding module family 20 domain-containing protein [Oligoflexus sp.]|uniref:carbohydrate-binding module family 20 domain-containing protein n=1 Tax=Oligoflexus sp. TaxID=1971216 RepID=UPI002D3F1A92|nr:carbohydrate-binding module family 20 domain-containing protein [Oligoflexus sp.]HYX35453.1 carbohydrate-binding module family 20 domain-containing protein [Oligoflexus sp.]
MRRNIATTTRNLLWPALILVPGSLQASPLWICDGGQSEIHWLPETETVQVRLRDSESLSRIRASLDQEACAENYYSPTHDLICLKKELAGNAHWQDESLIIDDLKRWNFGTQLQFLAGQYRPSLEPTADGWVVHLRNAAMANSKTLIQWDNGPITLRSCKVETPYPKARVRIQVLGDQYVQGTRVSSPLPNVTVYAGDWHAGHKLGETDNEGMVSLDLEVGSTAVSVMKLTSSHSALWSEPQFLDVTPRLDTVTRLHLAPITVRLSTPIQVPYGKAVYITGEGDYLGHWQVATRLTAWADGRWELLKNLPVGASYKLLVADWTDQSTLGLNGQEAAWEMGPNHQIPPLSNYYEVVIEANPRFP